MSQTPKEMIGSYLFDSRIAELVTSKSIKPGDLIASYQNYGGKKTVFPAARHAMAEATRRVSAATFLPVDHVERSHGLVTIVFEDGSTSANYGSATKFARAI